MFPITFRELRATRIKSVPQEGEWRVKTMLQAHFRLNQQGFQSKINGEQCYSRAIEDH